MTPFWMYFFLALNIFVVYTIVGICLAWSEDIVWRVIVTALIASLGFAWTIAWLDAINILERLGA